MKTLTEKELRELDAWIAEHSKEYPDYHIELNVFCLRLLGWKLIRPRSKFGPVLEGVLHGGEIYFSCPFVTRENDSAMQVLQKCAEKLFDSCEGTNICISKSVDGWIVDEITTGQDYGTLIASTAETLPLAICLFAKQIFSK